MPSKPKQPKPTRPNGISASEKTPVTKNAKSKSSRNRNGKNKKGGSNQKQRQHERSSSSCNESFVTSTVISDNDVHVNMAMADLMGYLQVVADNSNNLPLTRRDDPELGRTVSTLSTDEYTQKSAAFLPADARVIGGTFAKYGRVWDLPTSEEFSVVDGAQEPGRSYGGACCNAMLKVLYDAENEVADRLTEEVMDGDNLFDDDDEESMLGSTSVLDYRRQRSLELGDFSAPSSITFADLLRRMKSEMLDIDHAQTPTITSSRKIDLNKPFTLIPENFNKTTGVKRSLLIGCNYTNIEGADLKAAHDDIRSMKDYIVNVHGFSDKKGLMTILLDDDDHKHPTHMNITEAFKVMSEQSKPGDAVFVQFSGHGGRVLDATVNDEAESYDEAIIPSDFQTSGLIRDTLIFKTLLAPMRSGVTVTILIDTCDTGMIVDLPFSWSTKKKSDLPAKMSMNDDFSFVRFLKIVKTLYESSIFTQLGNTVGNALNAPPPQAERDKNEYDTTGEDEYDDEDTKASNNVSSGCSNWFPNPFSPSSSSSVDNNSTRSRKKSSGNILEQVMTCGLGQDGDSDVDTYAGTFPGSYDDGTVTTYDTQITDRDSISHNRQRRKAKA